ncbi:hypothetical protein IID20_01815 [Patescibacteria group bacterium]|nr:hypothetical protein [Patescibacteria group bacterium]
MRSPNICPYCGKEIKWIGNPTPKNFVGDMGGSYESHSCPEEKKAFLNHFMPIKYGSPLFSKLKKKYWELPHVKGYPLLFAIEDFSNTNSLTFGRSSLPTYLYGYEHKWEYDEHGKLHITPIKIDTHKWMDKEIPSGFFYLEGSENVSAVVFSNSGTISKFNRMGLLAGFGSSRVQMVRIGSSVNHDPNSAEPKTFKHLVNDPSYKETWVEGLEVFHNPRALHPIDPIIIPGASHHRLLENGQIDSLSPEWHPLASITNTFVVEDD